MTLIPKLNITQDTDTGLNILINEITGNYTSENTGGYGGTNPAITDVTVVRFLFSSYLTETQADQNVTECVAGYEYEVWGTGAGDVVVDDKTFVLGDVFILEVDATPVIGDDLYLKETGRFSFITDFLPADGSVEVTPSSMGIDETTFPDSVYHAKYEVYTTDYLQSAPFPAGTYYVLGDALNVIEVASTGYKYNAGEVFTVDGSDTFTDVTGTNSVCKLNAYVTYNFPLFYNAIVLYNSIQQEYVSDTCANKPCLEQKLFKMNTLSLRLQLLGEGLYSYRLQLPLWIFNFLLGTILNNCLVPSGYSKNNHCLI